MHVLLEKYKLKLSYLPLSEFIKKRIVEEFERQLLIKMLDAFYHLLTSDEIAELDRAKSNDDLAETYLTLILKKIDYPECIRFLDEAYSEFLSKAVNQLPDNSANK